VTDLVAVLVTAADAAQAEKIARALVEERLAACANILPGMVSIFRWEGEIQEANEAVLILKSHGDLLERLTARIKALHSYSVPCVVGLPIQGGNEAFLGWIAAECGAGR
jgi:periplasmic divalent cation tolerance protein